MLALFFGLSTVSFSAANTKTAPKKVATTSVVKHNAKSKTKSSKKHSKRVKNSKKEAAPQTKSK